MKWAVYDTKDTLVRGQANPKRILAFGLSMSIFMKRLKAARIRAGLSQEKLGVLAGIDEASASARMNQYERGKHEPDSSMVERLARVLDVPVAMFYAEEDDEADLLRTFYRLSNENRAMVLEFAKSIWTQEDSEKNITTK